MTKPFTSVPVIDIAPFFFEDAAAKRAVADGVSRARETIGFLYIDGHGFDPALIIGTHSDYECFAILWQDGSGGLQIQNQAGDWIDAPPVPCTFVINIGGMLAHWSNDRFASTEHRVVYGAMTTASP